LVRKWNKKKEEEERKNRAQLIMIKLTNGFTGVDSWRATHIYCQHWSAYDRDL